MASSPGRIQPARILPVRSEPQLAAAVALIRGYTDGLDLDLSAQGIEAELAGLPGRYAPPGGDLFLATAPEGAPLGCIGFRPLDATTCEIKRLFVAPAGRGQGLGRQLARHALDTARAAGHRRAVLDTLPSMAAAIDLYRSLGFMPIPPYDPDGLPGVLCFGLDLVP